jgi:DNA-directed RNA polymerase specialized sigma24 family protein
MAFDFETAERELASTEPTPEDVFLREWEREVFARALADLKALGKPIPWRVFEQYDLCDEPRPSYAELAAEHGIPVTTVTNHLAWARRELRRLARARMERS